MIKEELKEKFEGTLFDEPMSRYTSLRVGGAADALVYPKSVEDLLQIVEWCRSKKTAYTVMGAGSNLLVRDKGIRGVVISLSKGFSALRLEEGEQVYAEAGVGLPRLVDFTAAEGFAGVEGLSGIPGNLGGALTMNAGTGKCEIGAVVESVSFVDKDARLMTWASDKIRFEYRKSHFPRGAILVSARLKLEKSDAQEIQKKIKKDREKRLETQPLNIPNIGSVFKNPQKGFAGSYIEEAGLKNVRIGGARVSPKHANFIVNEGEATSKDVIALMGLVRDKVREKFGFLLEPEVRVVGEE